MEVFWLRDDTLWKDDPEVQKAIQSMPKAQSLLMTVQRVLADRGVRG